METEPLAATLVLTGRCLPTLALVEATHLVVLEVIFPAVTVAETAETVVPQTQAALQAAVVQAAILVTAVKVTEPQTEAQQTALAAAVAAVEVAVILVGLGPAAAV
jgi:hypothetical protein